MPAGLSDVAVWLKPSVMAALLAILWVWEGLQPYFDLFPARKARLRHAGRNLTVTLLNTMILGITFSAATVGVALWTSTRGIGLLNLVAPPLPLHWLGALLLLDGWLYVWHRLNHRLPLLWRFHRMHHSDACMDVTTATRFHLGELALSSVLRLGLIPLFGVTALQLVVYDSLVIANTLLHHANVSLGRCDRWLRCVIVTPDIHKVHHSRLRRETDSNYSTILSVWDRLAGTLRLRDDCRSIQFGLDEFDDPYWQTVRGLWATPLARAPSEDLSTPENARSADQVARTA